MEKERKIKRLSLVALIVAVLGLTVAFAALSQQLTIEGTATVGSSSWGVKFKSIVLATKSGDASIEQIDGADKEPTITNNTTITLPKISLKKPGDKVEYTIEVENYGNIDATIKSVTYKDKTCSSVVADEATAFCNGNEFSFKLENADATEVAAEQKLAKGSTKTMKLTVEYVNTVGKQELPSQDITISNLGVDVNYVQFNS